MACNRCAAREAASCNLQIDYSKVQGNRILPFVIRLNTEKSVLEPETGELQRFCYDITGVGEDHARYANLSHFVMGICDQIREEDLAMVTVSIDGVMQDVEIGENVEIRRTDKPDPPTGCAGIKFDFPLNKTNGVMQVCFALRTPYGIGSTPVCLYGGNATADGLAICGPMYPDADHCTAMGYQCMRVSLPVTVTPYVRAGRTTTVCTDEPVVTSGAEMPSGRMSGSCTFTISQRLCVAVPVMFGAHVSLGDYSTECLGAFDENTSRTVSEDACQ